jgi:hypothetical protein
MLVLLGAVSCAEPRPKAPAEAGVAPSHVAPEPAAAPKPTPKPERPTVKAMRGELLRGGPLAEGQVLEPDSVLALKAGAVLTLDFARGARLFVHGPAELIAAPEGAHAVLLRRGAAALDLAPAALTPDSGFLVVTPGLHLALVRGGTLAVRAFDDGSSEAIVVAGNVGAVAGDAAMVGLGAGQGLRVGLRGQAERAQLGALTLEAALARLQELPPRPADEAQLRSALDGDLDRLVEQVAAEVAREGQLVAAHRARIGTQEALPAQADVAKHAGQLARVRGRLRALLWRRAALRLEAAPAADDALGQRARGLTRK